MSATVKNGLNKFTGETLVGMSVGEVRESSALSGILSLTGSEEVSVQFAGESSFTPVDDDHIIEDGDTVSFTRDSGSKGVS